MERVRAKDNMINRIKYNIQFRKPMWGTSGVFTGDHSFEEGLTVIFGPNESGKSLILEMMRTALFGSTALRSPLSDYKRMNLEFDFVVKGVAYNITRSKTTALLSSEGKSIATGTKPVNEAVAELFGYDVPVFNVANACLQGKIDELGEMKPAQRKALVDNVIGLSSIDDTIKELGLTARDLRAELKGLQDNLSVPSEPTVKMSMDEDEMQHFIECLDSHMEHKKTQVELAVVEAMPVPDEVTVINPTPEQLEQMDKYASIVVANSEFDHTTRLMNAIKFEEVQATKTQVEEWRDHALKYEATQEVQCPKCDHKFNLAGVDIPAYTVVACEEMLGNLRREDDYHQLNANRGTRVDIVPYQRAVEVVHVFEAAKLAFTAREEAISFRTEQLDKLNKLLLTLDLIEDFDSKEKRYMETASARMVWDEYNLQSNLYKEKLEKVKEFEENIKNHTDMVTALRNVKTSVKAFLVPSLNKVASSYLSLLTGGVRNTVIISENFNIEVDGQNVEALSGSAKAVANLSIRLALGQTLTNSVFSVFMADEIDAAMDDNRVEYTAKCLRNLTDKVSQVFLVSHKKIEADHYLELK